MELIAEANSWQLPLVSVRFFKLRAHPVQFHHSPLQLVKEQVDHWSGEQGERLANHQSADDCDAQRSAQFRSDAHTDGQRHTAEHGGERGHHNRPETQQCGTVNRFYGRHAQLAFSLQRKVNHHDGVFDDQADEQNDPDERDDVQVRPGDQQGQNSARACRRQE